MFIILIYDVQSKKCNKMLKTCRKYLQWVQNSVLEGEITNANYERLISELKGIIDKKTGDSIIVYKFRSKKYFNRLAYGEDKKDDIKFL